VPKKRAKDTKASNKVRREKITEISYFKGLSHHL